VPISGLVHIAPVLLRHIGNLWVGNRNRYCEYQNDDQEHRSHRRITKVLSQAPFEAGVVFNKNDPNHAGVPITELLI
jgi:hypothetical protein